MARYRTTFLRLKASEVLKKSPRACAARACATVAARLCDRADLSVDRLDLVVNVEGVLDFDTCKLG